MEKGNTTVVYEPEVFYFPGEGLIAVIQDDDGIKKLFTREGVEHRLIQHRRFSLPAEQEERALRLLKNERRAQSFMDTLFVKQSADAMVAKSRIEWTEHTWNPTTGCTKVSPGCKHCYAETMARRLQAMGVAGYENGFNLSLMPSRLNEPLSRLKPTVYFINSMSDLFHEEVPDGFVEQVLNVVWKTPQHTYQVLTKRACRLNDFFADKEIPRNLWLGVSVETRVHGKPRIRLLRDLPARIRFLSIEPLLEDIGTVNLRNIEWVIVGGEAGWSARPIRKQWVINILRQCIEQNAPFFFKQWGSYGADGIRRAKKRNGRLLDGRIWNQLPAYP